TDTRYFIVKSWTDENVYRCMEEGIWVTQQHNEGLLNQAFTQTKNVILFFSANQSKAFQGYARMISPTSPKNSSPRWVSGLRWASSNPFRVRWLSKIEVEFFRIGHLRNSLNEGLAVLVGKDGQEIEERCGANLLAEMFAIAQDKYERRDASLSFRNQ
ncbi:YTH domain-containing protein, partial [Schizothecium vesticola]